MPTFSFTTVDYPVDDPSWPSYLMGINDSGVVVGQTQTATGRGGHRAFVDDHGDFLILDSGRGPTYAGDINGDGIAVGSMQPTGIPTGFWADPIDGISRFRAPDGTNGTLTGNNDAGQTVGTYYIAGAEHPFYTDADGTYHDIPVPGAASTNPQDITNTGRVVGDYIVGGKTHGFVEDKGQFFSVDVPGATETHLTGANDTGQMVGYYKDGAGQSHGFVRGVEGKISSLDVPGAVSTQAWGIDNSRDIVGAYTSADGHTHGFVSSWNLETLLSIGGQESLAQDMTPKTIGHASLASLGAASPSAAHAPTPPAGMAMVTPPINPMGAPPAS